ncbi:MAG: hypothetical protein ACRCV3_00980 [Desulfovibrionaceae bacterium]
MIKSIFAFLMTIFMIPAVFVVQGNAAQHKNAPCCSTMEHSSSHSFSAMQYKDGPCCSMIRHSSSYPFIKTDADKKAIGPYTVAMNKLLDAKQANNVAAMQSSAKEIVRATVAMKDISIRKGFEKVQELASALANAKGEEAIQQNFSALMTTLASMCSMCSRMNTSTQSALFTK